MKLSDFDYCLPKELIAQYPLKERQKARLLVLNRENKALSHSIFNDITGYLNKNDLLVLNNTRVVPARLFGRRLTGGKTEVLLLNRKDNFRFKAMLKPGRLKINEEICFNGGSLKARITAKDEIEFQAKDISEIYKQGVMPLPPYIKRDCEDLDNIYYQTVYAQTDGSVAAPTAGLHFTEKLLEEIKLRGINIAYVTLHVGSGTFKPVKSDDIAEHKMDSEEFSIPQETIDLIKKTRESGGRIIAVGTTSLRVLETFALGNTNGFTDLFIYPGYKFKFVDCLLTNFHLPRTTLFMLVCALAGEAKAKAAYQEAIEKEYRFYSYGDAMLIV